VTRIALVAPSRLALEHLALLLQHDPHLTTVARSARLESLTDHAWATRADVALVAVDQVARLRTVLADPDANVAAPPLVVLTSPRSRTDVAALVDVGVKGILPPDAGPREVAAAIDAVAAGLTVLAPTVLSVLQSRPDQARVATGAAHGAVQGSLSPREREILALVAEGLGNKIVAARLGISEHTVKTHITSIFEKLGAESRAEAVAIGARTGVILL
jgi:DNA-binding NarL/FixJ family response regulator